MKTQDIIIARPSTTEQVNVIKAFMEALKIKFDISKPIDNPYNPDFIAKIDKSRKEFKNGDFISVEQEDLQNILGL